ncbi:uroporphyrinogen-III synthase [Streptomyces glaucescens]
MYEQQPDNGTRERAEHGPLAGFTVGVTAARRADELGALLQRRGAAVLHAPALRIVPLADDSELLAATKELLDRVPDVVVATTAIGFRGWVEAADGWGLGEPLLERLRGVELLARGPKVKGAIRAAGLTEDWSPCSESLAEVLDRLLAEGVDGRRIAVQLHGEPLPGFVEALRAGGAEVVGVPVYRWLPPEDLTPVDRLLDAVVSRGVDALTFTSAPAAQSLLNRAEERGLLPDLLAALGHDVLPACVGPVTALPLQAHGVDTVQPERFRLGAARPAALQGTARSGAVVAGRRAPGGDPRARRAGGRGAAAGAARGDVPAAGAVPAAGLGGGAGRAAAGPAGGGPRRARRRDRDGPAADGPRRPETHPDRRQTRLPAGPRPGGRRQVRRRLTHRPVGVPRGSGREAGQAL